MSTGDERPEGLRRTQPIPCRDGYELISPHAVRPLALGVAPPPPSSPPPPPPPRMLGAWRILEELGVGGMGRVWLVERADGAFHMKAAAKVIKRQIASQRFIERFVHERQILADLKHSCICRLLDGGTLDDGRPYLVMEYVEGSSLDEYTQREMPPREALLQLFIKICDALTSAHSRGVVHCDLKPSNVMVTASGEPKLLDFGIACSHASAIERLTETGLPPLTPAYASPEQWAGAEVGPRSDIFTLGVMMIESLADWRPARPGITGMEPPAEIRAHLGDELYAVLARAVCHDAQERFPDVAELGDALRALVVSKDPGSARRVFISTRSDDEADQEIALLCFEALTCAGMTPFLTPKSASRSDNWVRAVTQAMRRCDVFLLLVSRRTARSQLVAGELELARRLNEENHGRPLIVPVRVGDQGDWQLGHTLGAELDDLECIEWTDTENADTLIAALQERLRYTAERAAMGSHGIERYSFSSLGGVATTKDPHPSTPGPSTSGPSTLRPSNLKTVDLPGDIIHPDSPYYVARPRLEDSCLSEILEPGALIRIKGPRQMGKTSLMRRILAHAHAHGARTVSINLDIAEHAIVADLDRFLRWLCAAISRRLKISRQHIAEGWDEIFGAKDNCTAYFEDHLLVDTDVPLVLGIDRMDRVFESSSTAEEFFALLRAWHEMGKSQEPWPALRMVLVHATETYLPLNINHSPFNVGLPVSLDEWDADMVRALGLSHGLELGPDELRTIMELLGGHPHLVRIALHHMHKGMRLQDIVATAATDEGLFSDHLKYLLWHLELHPDLGRAASRVIRASEPVHLRTELAFKLASLGLVHIQGNGVVPARELYRRYLVQRLDTRNARR